MIVAARSDALAALAALAIASLAGGAVAAEPRLAIACAGVIGVACFVALAVLRPRLALALSTSALVLVPVIGWKYAGPFLLHPGVLGLWVLAGLASCGVVLKRSRGAATVIDGCAALIFGGMLLAVLWGSQPLSALLTTLWLWVGAYVVGRAFSASGSARAVLIAVATAGVISLPFAVAEVIDTNPFVAAYPAAADTERALGTAFERLGSNRVQGALGQPIPFAMFVALAALAAAALWLVRVRPSWWLAASLALLAVMSAAVSRTGWLMIAVAALTVLALAGDRVLRGRNAKLIVGLVCASLALIAIGPTRSLLLGGGDGQSAAQIAQSSAYRDLLVRKARKPGAIPTFGTSVPLIVVNRATSVDNMYILLGRRWGWLPMLGLALLVPAVAWSAWVLRRDTLAVSVCAMVLASLIALWFVAFLTQQQVFIWLLVGCASGLVAVRPR